MNRKAMMIGIAAVWLAVLGGLAIYAQDSGQSKYAVKVPGGLAFSEFRGYEAWQTISMATATPAVVPPDDAPSSAPQAASRAATTAGARSRSGCAGMGPG